MTSAPMKRTAQVAALAAAFTMSGSAVALAGTHTTSGNHSILGGNQINVPISIPVSVCGNAAALLGTALAGCQGGAFVLGGSGGSNSSTSGNNSILGGNQVNVPVSAPVSVCGNSAAGLGTALSGCRGGASVRGGSGSGGASWTTSGNHSIGGGNQVNVPVNVPVSVCGISAALLGTALSGCEGGASVASGGGGTWSTSGNHSIGGGNQVSVPVKVPVSVCGISAAGLGTALSGCGGGAHTGPPPCKHHHTPPPCKCHHTPPPCKCHHRTPPPGKHHHPTPPVGHHHHGGSGSSSSSSPIVTGASLPTTGANFVGLLALAGGAIVAGAGSMMFAAKRGLFGFFRRTSTATR
jgi:ChpA-C